MTTVLNKNGNPVHDWQKPTFGRKTNRKNSSLWWSETCLGSYQEHKLSDHMEAVRKELLAMFDSNRALLAEGFERYAFAIQQFINASKYA